ncbi:MAG TPA: nicotinate-nucleotide adenylyltransferase [Gemmatimonadaceae bacterium]|nr:nicotinate-nucleotide adenylyltransferase [Gemmatimonadaceae bacterium]
MRVAIFGGSFDPPHIGHLLAATDAFEALALDRLIFVPAAVQPLKVGRAAATAAQRLAMVQRLAEGDPRFTVDPIEIDREGLSYTVDTLESLARTDPADERFLLLGADALAAFPAWREPERIVRLARLAVLRRPGSAGASAAVPGPAPVLLQTRFVEVSSSEIRERVKAGKPIRGFVTDSVAELIASERLYR